MVSGGNGLLRRGRGLMRGRREMIFFVAHIARSSLTSTAQIR